jgi:hypothetical protein
MREIAARLSVARLIRPDPATGKRRWVNANEQTSSTPFIKLNNGEIAGSEPVQVGCATLCCMNHVVLTRQRSGPMIREPDRPGRQACYANSLSRSLQASRSALLPSPPLPHLPVGTVTTVVTVVTAATAGIGRSFITVLSEARVSPTAGRPISPEIRVSARAGCRRRGGRGFGGLMSATEFHTL